MPSCGVPEAGGRKGDQLEESPAAHHDLAVERIRLGKEAGRVHVEGHGISTLQPHEPGLAVVRVGGQQAMGQDEAAGIGLALARLAPGGIGIWRFGGAGAAGRREDRGGGQELEDVASGGHGSALLLRPKLYHLGLNE